MRRCKSTEEIGGANVRNRDHGGLQKNRHKRRYLNYDIRKYFPLSKASKEGRERGEGKGT